MYPSGHARNTTADLAGILDAKFRMLGSIACKKPKKFVRRLSGLEGLSAKAMRSIYEVDIIDRGRFE
jgi:hypothetical protein